MAADTTLAKLRVLIDANLKPYKDGMEKVKSITRSTTDTVNSQMRRMKGVIAGAISVAAITAFSKSCIELGSDLAEVQNVVDVTFGNMSEQVNQFAKNALTTYGLSETSAKQFTSTMGAMLKSMGLTTQQAYDMGTSLTALSADMASFYNLDAQTAFEKIRSGISGETEPLKQLGINMSVANLEAFALAKGITKSYNAMTQQEQALLRYNYLLSVTKDAQGDFSRTSDQWANQVRILTERFNSLRAAIGQGLIYALTPVIRVLNQLLERLITVSNAFSDFMAKITGNDKRTETSVGASVDSLSDFASIATDASDATTNIGDAAEDSAKKAKKAVASLMGFDQIHKLSSAAEDASDESQNEDTGMAGLTAAPLTNSFVDAATAGNRELSPVLQKLIDLLGAAKDKLKELAEIWKEGFKSGLGVESLEDFKRRLEPIKENILAIGRSLKGIFGDPEVQNAANDWATRTAYALGQVAGSALSIGITLAENLTGGIRKYLDQNTGRIKGWLISMFDISGDIWEMTGDWAESIAYVFSAFGGENGQQLTANIIGIFADGFMGVTELAGKFARDVTNIITKPIIDNKEKLRTAFDELLGILAEVTGTIKGFVDHIVDKLNEMYDEHIKPFLDSVAEGLSYLLGVYIDSVLPVLQEIGDKVEELFNQHLSPLVDSLIDLLGALFDVLKILWEAVLEPFLGWLIPILAELTGTLLTGLIDGIGFLADCLRVLVDIITSVIEAGVQLYNNWDEIKVSAVEVWDGIKDAIGEDIELIKTFFGGLRDSISAMKDDISSLFSNIRDDTQSKWSDIKNGIQSKVSDIKNNVSSKWNEIKNDISTKLSSIKSDASSKWASIKSDISSKISGIKSNVNSGWSNIKSAISSRMSGIRSDVSGGFSNIASSVSNSLSNLRNSVVNIWEGIKNTFSNAISYIRNLFNFEWHFPHISLPHFSWEWIDLGGIVSIPSISVSWYAQGGFPKLGELFMAGENGPEMVGKMGGRNAVANNDQIVEGVASGVFDAVYAAMSRIMSENGGNGGDVVLMVDSEELARATNRGNRRLDRRYNPSVKFS